MTGARTIEKTELQPRSINDLLPPYAVILHNDDVNSMEFVVAALLKSVPELTEERAVEVMLEAHLKGRSVVTVCPLEKAEFYRDRIKTFNLGCTIEKA